MSEKQVNLLIFQYLPPLLPHRISCSDASQMLLRAELKLSIFFLLSSVWFHCIDKMEILRHENFLLSMGVLDVCVEWHSLHLYWWVVENSSEKILPFFPSRENRFIFCKFSHSQFHTAFHGELFGFLRYCKLHKFNLLYYFKDILNMSAFWKIMKDFYKHLEEVFFKFIKCI